MRMSSEKTASSPCQFLSPPLGDDLLVSGFESDRVDSNLIEIAALLDALLSIDIRVTSGQGFADVMAGWAIPRWLEVDDVGWDDAIDALIKSTIFAGASLCQSSRPASISPSLRLLLR